MMPQRIRNRREALEMQGYQLAKRAGISPSYLSLIENGSKVPSESIAVRLARALNDDAELYRAWAHASRLPDLDQHVNRLQRLLHVRQSPELIVQLRRGDSYEEISPRAGSNVAVSATPTAQRLGGWVGRARRAFARADDPDGPQPEAMMDADAGEVELEYSDPILAVPLYDDGADPGDASPIDSYQIDRRLLPADVTQPFAYRPGARTVARVSDAIRAGNVVVLGPGFGRLDTERIYAVRYEGRVLLSRVVVHDNVLLLLPGPEGGSPLALPFADQKALDGHVAGVVLMSINSWDSAGAAERRTPSSVRPSGRAVRVVDGVVVRDCEWKERYGWRPIQHAEEMDYLDAHHGSRIRYRLLRNGKLRFVLEMTAEEWRAALGEYVDSDSWRRNDYIVAITRRRDGSYTEEFQDRWAPYVRKPAPTD
jgi:transcriptional regulator with XRE-family HTH domain